MSSQTLEILLKKLNPNKYMNLKEYSNNKSLLIKSRAIKFIQNFTFFEERAVLFIELCYLLIKIQIQKRDVYISNCVFVNHQSYVFMMFTFDQKYAGKFKKINHGDLINNIEFIFYILFLQDQEKQNEENGNRHVSKIMEDFEKKTILESTHDLLGHLEQFKEREQDFNEPLQNGIIWQSSNIAFQSSNTYSVMRKLQSSQIFKQFSFSIKYNTGLLIKTILNDKDVCQAYKQFLSNNCNLYQQMRLSQNYTYCLHDFYNQMNEFFKFVQKTNSIKLITVEPDPKLKQNSTKINFSTNLRKYPSTNRTSNERSSQSSIKNTTQMLPQVQKDKLRRQRQNLQKINQFKNKIMFKIEVNVNINNNKSQFIIGVQAMSQWIIDEFYYCHFNKIWSQFLNNWYNSIFENSQQKSFQRFKPLKLELFHEDRKIGFRQTFTVYSNGNILSEITIKVDKLIIIFILFQNILKTMHKVSHNISQIEQQYFIKIGTPTHIDYLITQLKQAFQEYAQYYSQLECIQYSLANTCQPKMERE